MYGSYSEFLFNFLKKLPNCFRKWLHYFTFSPAVDEGSNLPTSLPTFSLFFIIVILLSIKWYIIMVICFSLILLNVFMCLFFIYRFFIQYLFMLLSIFNWSVFCLFLNSNLSSLCSLATNLTKCRICSAFFYGVPFLHTYWCLWMCKVFNFDKVQLLNICSSCAFSITSKKSLPNQQGNSLYRVFVRVFLC